jgi:hypothetical protein
MTKQPHPITPPPELVAKWASSMCGYYEAARWGADQELEACCEWFICDWTDIETADKLRAARRPKPPSLKEQALEALGRFSANSHTTAHQMQNDFDLFRRALEALDD